jgi:NAD(P)-dependent dehydrogenase (short-subunit alcohol dehydrogenase family)
VIVTGCEGSIGRAITEEFRSNGWFVVGTDRLASLSGTCDHYIEQDLVELCHSESARAEFAAKVDSILADRLRLSCLVNNAAVQIIKPTAILTLAEFQQTLDVNLVAPFVLSQMFHSDLEANSGCIVNVSSIHARLTKPGFVAYATSKSALSGLTRAMAVDLAGAIRVNGVEPAAVDTDMLREGFAHNSDGFEKLQSHHPSGRIGQPSEIARVIFILTDPGIGFLNGEVIGIDGAIGARLHDPA